MAFNFDQIKGLVDQVKTMGTEFAGTAADKAKDAAELARVTLALENEKKALKNAYLELGKAAYEEKLAADGVLGQLCGEVDAVKARIVAAEQELEALKRGFKTPDFEATVAESEPEIEVEITEE